MVKSTAVKMAGCQTFFHSTFTSGKYLNISMNNPESTAIETTKSSACPMTAVPPESLFVTVVSTVLTINDTMSRNATPITIANDKNLAFTHTQIPAFALGFTSQIVFMESCNSPNTPDAPKS